MIGIYEKALPKNISWQGKLTMAKSLSFDFVEMSIDETDERLARLNWTKAERFSLIETIYETNVKIPSICLSGHRRFPFGSRDSDKQKKAMEIMIEAIQLASDIGVRTIQLAGYDVYYENKSVLTREDFVENLKRACDIAAKYEVTLAIEIMDDPFMNSISKFLEIKQQVNSPWLQVYPDIGNLSAWPENNVGKELEIGIANISAIHLKDTLPVTPDFPGKFKEVPFGEGSVDFLGCLKTLKRLGYEGAFLMEMWSETSAAPAVEIKKAQDYLFPILKEAGYLG